MRKIVLILSLFFLTSYSFSQNGSFTVSLYYPVNEFLADAHKPKIDSLFKALNGKLIKVKVIGYADFLHSNNYNKNLSLKRAKLVKEYLLMKASPSQINSISYEGLGEKFSSDNQSPSGDASQRRVDVIIEPFIIVESFDNKVGEKKEDVQKKTVKKELEDLSKGESLAIDGLNFEPGRHFIVKESIPVLNNLLKTLKTQKNLKVEIQGHVCCTQGDSDGLDYDTNDKKLSENRAKAIYDFLVAKGIDKNRLTYKGYGHSKPKFPTESNPEEEQANRRVEVMVIDK